MTDGSLPRYAFGSRSREHLSTCTLGIQRWLQAAIADQRCPMDFMILEGHRTLEEQAKRVADGTSQVLHGYHNRMPSEAVDLVPYPVRWPEHQPTELQQEFARARFYVLAEYLFQIAEEQGIKVLWGNDWDGDEELSDHTFHDLPHWREVVDGQ